MELNTLAYGTLSIKGNPLDAGQIHLYNDEIISFTPNEFSAHIDLYRPLSIRQKYTIKFLDKHDKDVPGADRFARLTYDNSQGKKENLFIKVDTATKARLMWTNNMTWFQRNSYSNTKWTIATLIALGGLLWGIFNDKKEKATNEKIKTLEVELASLQIQHNEGFFRYQTLASDISRIDSLLDSLTKPKQGQITKP